MNNDYGVPMPPALRVAVRAALTAIGRDAVVRGLAAFDNPHANKYDWGRCFVGVACGGAAALRRRRGEIGPGAEECCAAASLLHVSHASIQVLTLCFDARNADLYRLVLAWLADLPVGLLAPPPATAREAVSADVRAIEALLASLPPEPDLVTLPPSPYSLASLTLAGAT